MGKLKEKSKFRQKGITLIALVITIVILIILATITINFAFGENGLVRSAESAREFYANDTQYTEESIANVESYIDGIINGDSIEVEQVIDENPGVLEGNGTNTDPYVINSIEDLVFFSYDVTNNGNTYEGKTVKLGLSLDFNSDKSYVDPNSTNYTKYGYDGALKQKLTSGTGFNPIGELSTSGTKYFYGTFDGDNKAICSLYINIDKEESVRAGLFSACYGEIKNLGLVNIKITVQGLGTAVGGIAGRMNNNISNSYVTGSINVTGSSWMPVGGLCGVMQEEASIENCYNLANINATNVQEEVGVADLNCGGIVGQGEININKCYNKGNITAKGENIPVSAGGICGMQRNSGTVKNSYNSAKIEASSNANREEDRVYVGGIIGFTSARDLQYCYNSGEIVGNAEILYIGGITGNLAQEIIISDVFNIGKILIKNEKQTVIYAGGINGGSAGGNSQINNAYNIGKISAEHLDISNLQGIGSIIGNNTNNSITFNNCNYLLGTYDKGVGGTSSYTGVTELDSIDKFPSVLEVVNVEGAFEEDRSNVNNGYPILQWQ